jgi:hypothetical protein|tara:strand:- start:7452 stop:7649 length:198 start_codon:yes stop_codon:yes gene_type:complete
MKFEVGDLVVYESDCCDPYYGIVIETDEYYGSSKEHGFRAQWFGADCSPVYYSDGDIESYKLVNR